MTPTRIVLAAGAVAGVFGLSLGVASVASAASRQTPTTPTTAPAATPSTTAPATGPRTHMKGDCPNMGGSGGSGSTTPSASESGL